MNNMNNVDPTPGTHVLVVGSPFDGMRLVGPVWPNSRELEELVETEFRNMDWWLVPLESPERES